MDKPMTPAVFLVKYLSAETTEDKKACIALARECPDETRRLAAAEGVELKV